MRRRGPFAFEPNNSTREFEYPWAYHQILAKSQRPSVVEIGGSLSGLQFALAMAGCEVVNVDPGIVGVGRRSELSIDLHAELCRVLRATVRLVPKPIQEANLPSATADILLSISVLEHFASADLDALSDFLPRILKADGVAVLTVDLFLDCEPFCRQRDNEWGRNIDICDWLDRAGLELVVGDRRELYGFPEFSADHVLRNLRTYHIGRYYPALAQCLVARRKGRSEGQQNGVANYLGLGTCPDQ
jgi:hypothetical protein